MDGAMVTEAIARLRGEGRPVNVRSVRALTGGSNRDVVPLVRQFKAQLNEEEAAEMEADLLEAEGAEMDAIEAEVDESPAVVGELARAKARVDQADRTVHELQLRFQQVQARVRELQA